MSSDAELLTRWRAGDRAAGEALFERYYQHVERFFVNKVGAEIRDLVQDTFAALVKNQARLQDGHRFRSYLFSVAYNVLNDHLRDRYRRAAHGEVDITELSAHALSPSPSTALAERDEQRLLLEGLRRIPVADQSLLELFYWENLTTVDIAAVLAIPRNTVKSRLKSARERLEQVLRQLSDSDEVLASTLSGLETWARKCRVLLGRADAELLEAVD
jgi:RNA polymerase sigma-70 factor (ECF subfamily)